MIIENINRIHSETGITILGYNATETMKRSKATGPDNKYIGMVEILEEFSIEVITGLCNDIHIRRTIYANRFKNTLPRPDLRTLCPVLQ
jgi:hypothetical protein